ncbi:MAG: ATP:corrinoid adenosyltransferase BtuR/CobO/CobP [Oscillospiraceae bacterium]|nr:ATP:corrinoid adenosyltransferase BtuR/CobO/CobP [Oscillospiraceae bacterium]
MEQGLVHLYTGDGKGKTTAGIGLAVRAKGAGKRVLFLQFMKGMATSETTPLKSLGIEVVRKESSPKFVFAMTPEEKASYRQEQQDCFRYAKEHCMDFDLIVFDEAVSAISEGMIDEDDFIAFLGSRPFSLEVAITGRKPSRRLLDCADYCSEILMISHPYERGIGARLGIEY